MKYQIILLTIVCSTLAFSSCGDHRSTGDTASAVRQQNDTPKQDFKVVDAQPVAVSTVQPKYPEVARKAGVEGTVWLSVLVSDKGIVSEVKILKVSENLQKSGSSSGLPEAAIEAVKKWTFKPAQLNGKPVEVWVAIPFAFKLDKEKKK